MWNVAKTITGVIVTLLGLVGGWYAFDSHFITSSAAQIKHQLIVQGQNHQREKLEIQVAGALKDFSKQQQDFGMQQQQLLDNYRRISRREQLQADLRHYQFQVQYYKNILLKDQNDPIAAADLRLAQRMLEQVKAALKELER